MRGDCKEGVSQAPGAEESGQRSSGVPGECAETSAHGSLAWAGPWGLHKHKPYLVTQHREAWDPATGDFSPWIRS